MKNIISIIPSQKLIALTIMGFLILLFLCVGVDVEAQCPMCRLSAESNLAHGGTEGKGLNKGILYMFCAPYLLVGTLGFIWWRNKYKNVDDLVESDFED